MRCVALLKLKNESTVVRFTRCIPKTTMNRKRQTGALVGSLAGRLAIVLTCWSAAAAQESSQTAPDPLPLLLKAPNGLVNLGALDLPPSFLQHLADWEIRNGFRDAFRRVAADADVKTGSNALPTPPVTPPVAPMEAGPTSDPAVTRCETRFTDARIDQWMRYSFAVPNLRGFRAPVLEAMDNPWPMDVIASSSEQTYREAATYVAANLARDGLVRTVMNAMHRTTDLTWVRDGELNQTRLRAIGVPIDLLEYFTVDGKPLTNVLANWQSNSAPVQEIDAIASRAKFDFRESCRGFRVMLEDGSEETGTLRVQLPTNAYVYGEGDGSVLDVFRQLSQGLPDRRLWVSIHQRGVDGLMQVMGRWNVPNAARIMLVPHPANVTQWAQDNAKGGTAPGSNGSDKRRIATIVPRYASRTEARSEFVASDSFVFESLGNTVTKVVQSPLLFQGGNLLPITDPKNGSRILLIGEAEVYRNRALGLSAEQVLSAFKAEFGVDRCEVLSAVSFHIDLDFTARRRGNELVACVNDDVAGSRMIVADAAKALSRVALLDGQQSQRLLAALGQGDFLAAVAAMNVVLRPLLDEHGMLTSRAANLFVASSLESPAANASRVLAALDILNAAALRDEDVNATKQPAVLRQYIQALRRHDAARESLVTWLQQLGMRVYRVPGLCDHEVGFTYVNGVHLPRAYLMPVAGGAYEALDEAARLVMQQALGPDVTIEPIHAAAMQSKDGGLHCLLGLYPSIQ